MLNYPRVTVACFDPTRGELPRRELDVERLRRFLTKLAKANVPGVLIGSSTGHGHLRTVEELAEFFRAAAESPLGQTAKLALLRPEDGLEPNQEMLILLKTLGYQVVFFRPGNDLPNTASAEESDEQIVKQLQPLVFAAANLNFSTGLYSIPDVSGVALSAEAAAKLKKGPGGDRIVAIKVTEANYQQSTLRFLQHPDLRDILIVQGWDPYLAQALRDGPQFSKDGRQRCGVTSGPMSFAVFQYLHILAEADKENWAEVEKSQEAVTAIFTSMQDDPQRFADLQRAKFIMGLGHPFQSQVLTEQVHRVLTALKNLPRAADRQRLARSLNLMQDGPYADELVQIEQQAS